MSHNCAHCGSQKKVMKRSFGESAREALVRWGEISQSAIEAPICDVCYQELRDVLIDRADEVDLSAGRQQSKQAA